ncbi:MAG TPA: SDR family oxidoreductase [Hyphomicrobiaceae bacterium]|nr:SDR family oxidoreductase [Hyphomicrobiaceae bacterium]
MRLAGKIAIITGGASGIGHEASKLFAAHGAVVMVADRNLDGAGRVAQEIQARGGKASAYKVDVAQEAEVKAMIEAAVAGHGRLDILVNNAGYGIAGTVVTTSEADWDALMAVNVKGVFFGCKYAIPVMEKQGRGAIVNTASGAAHVGIVNRAAYVASKGAVDALTRAMATDHALTGIRINAVAPGTIETPYFAEMLAKSPNAAGLKRGLEMRQAMERLGKPIEIANAMLFLASDEASFCTGTTLVVDGGWTAQGDRLAQYQG